MHRSVRFAAALVAAVLVVGCKKESTPPAPTAPAPGQPAAGSPAVGGTPTPAAAGPKIPVVAIDQTPPNVPLVKYEGKLDDRELTFEAPAGCTVKEGFSGLGVTDGKGFGFRISTGRGGLANDRKWWKEGGGIYRPKSLAIDSPEAFMVESDQDGPQRYASAAAVTLPYTDLSVHSAKDGSIGADVQTKENCLLVLRCAKTIALKSPPPTEPEAALKWLKVDVRKSDDGKVTGLEFPSSTTDAALALAAKFPTATSLSLSGSNLTADGLAVLTALPNLESLDLEFYKYDAATLAQIGKATTLKSLSIGTSIGAADVDEAGMAGLGSLTALEELSFINSRAGDGALAAIKGLKNLKVLRMGSKQGDGERDKPGRMKLSNLTDAGLANLAGLTNLEVLDLRRTDITGSGLAPLAQMSKLRELDLSNTFLADVGLPHVGAAKSLESLRLARTTVTGAGLKPLANLSALKELDLTETDVTDDGLASLAGLKELETLRLRKTGIGDAGLAHLKGLEKLGNLNLIKTKVTDAGLMQLVGLKKIYSLYTDDTAVTKDGKAKFEKAKEGE